MPIKTKLPKSAALFQRITYPFIKSAFYFFFAYLPYGPVKREGNADFAGPILISGSHTNFLCDPVINAFETEIPPRFLGKHTLFRFPIKWLITYCGTIPIYRPQDVNEQITEGRSAQNRSAFKAAIQAFEDGWPVCIYPEGGSYVVPGLHMPLKPGVAKLALTAEEAFDFKLGLKIIPVGFEYGSRPKVGSGLIIRYGTPIEVKQYQKIYESGYGEAVRQLMGDLTLQMKAVFPHFETNEELLIAKRLVAMGVSPNRMDVSRIFQKYRANHPEILSGLQRRMRDFEEASKEQGISLAAWGYRKKFLKETILEKFISGFVLIFGLPFFIWDLVNNTFSEYLIRSSMGFFASDETEMMTVRFIVSFPLLPLVYLAQFWVLNDYLFPEILNNVNFSYAYFLYFIFSVAVWIGMPRWRRNLKKWLAQLFFIGKSHKVVGELDQELSQLSAWVRDEADLSRT